MNEPMIDPESGLPIGPLVKGPAARRPARVSLAGRFVEVRPLDANRDGNALWRETHGPGEARRWQYLFEAPFGSEGAFLESLRPKAASGDPMFFTIAERQSGRAMGYASLMRIEPAHGCIEVGNILLGAGLQRSAGATEAQYLLMRHAFDDLGYRRYEWKCNALNAPSRRAAERLGFTFEGIFRQHMIVRGRSRDTAWYAIIDPEWPAIRAALEQWLAPENFDPLGHQLRSLADFMRPGRPGMPDSALAEIKPPG
jgi:RimJ/RimL family protein N-acetyltransferase